MLPGFLAKTAEKVGLIESMLWQGRRLDPTGLYQMGTRYYSAEGGRLISADPLGLPRICIPTLEATRSISSTRMGVSMSRPSKTKPRSSPPRNSSPASAIRFMVSIQGRSCGGMRSESVERHLAPQLHLPLALSCLLVNQSIKLVLVIMGLHLNPPLWMPALWLWGGGEARISWFEFC